MRYYLMLLTLVPCFIHANNIIQFQGEVRTPTCVIHHNQLSHHSKNPPKHCDQDLTLKSTPLKKAPLNAIYPSIDKTLQSVVAIYN